MNANQTGTKQGSEKPRDLRDIGRKQSGGQQSQLDEQANSMKSRPAMSVTNGKDKSTPIGRDEEAA